jgi:hypothetical protein
MRSICRYTNQYVRLTGKDFGCIIWMSSDLYRNQIAHQYLTNIAEFRHNLTCRCAIPNTFSLGTQVFGDERLTAVLLEAILFSKYDLRLPYAKD